MNTKDQLTRLLKYDPETGVFRWRLFMGGNAPAANEIAGSLSEKGYVVICHKRKSYKAHRLAWLYVFGQIPDGEIDHINNKKNDNRIANLRCVTRAINQQNISAPQGKNKYRGVSFDKRKKRFLAQIAVNKTHHKLGYFDSAEEALDVYLKARRELHPGAVF